MSDIAISRKAQNALVKTLIRTGLIQDKAENRDYSQRELCPIEFYANQDLFDQDQAIQTVSKAIQVPIADLSEPRHEGYILLLDHSKLEEISIERWSALRCIPVDLNDKQLVIACANPLDRDSQESMRFDLGCEIRVCIAREDQIQTVLKKKLSASNVFDLDSLLDKHGNLPSEPNSPELEHEQSNQAQESSVSDNDIEAPPVIRLVNKILAEAVQRGASDIHINPQSDHVAIKIRVDGIMNPLHTIPNSYKNAVISRLKLLSGMDITEKRRPQDGRLRIKTGFGVKDLRLSTVATVHGENVVIRILCSDITKISFDNLGISDEQKSRLTKSLCGSSRVILVTGPTGSGKTTTLYAFLLSLRDGSSNIMTIEDPIEYRIHGVNQMQVNSKIDVNFAEGLRSILRQDPDVIMVGEIRDLETAETAMQAAQTGHLVLSTLHTNTAASALTRLLDLGLPSFVLASSLGCIVAQRLVRTLCKSCKTKIKKKELEALNLPALGKKLYKAKGCEKCGGSGYQGRIAIYSILEIDDAVRDAIREEKGEREIESLASKNGFEPLLDAGLKLITKGETSIEELERVLGSLTATTPSKTNVSMENPEIRELPLQNGNGANHKILAEGPLAKRRLLLVEDDETTRTVLSMLLERELFHVTEACDGLEALEKIYQNPPEIIVCDLMMPKMNGFDLVKKVRKDSRLKNIPILMLTAADSEDNEVSCIDSGADDFVSKASDSKVMLSRIQRLLEKT